jgi:hypothetical protein
VVHYDLTAIHAAGKRLGALREQVERSRGLLGDGGGAPAPFGELDPGGEAHQALSGFQAGVHDEFGHALEHLDRSAASLRNFANGVQGTDTHNAQAVHHAAAKPAGPVAPAVPDTAPEVGNARLDDAR